MNTCPHCGMPARQDYWLEFRCGSQRQVRGVTRSPVCYGNEIAQLRERVAALTAAGQHAVDYCNGKHSMLNEVLDWWRKATQ